MLVCVCMPWSPLMYHVALGKFHHLSEPQFPHLKNGNMQPMADES